MSGFADLVPESMPAYFGGGHSSTGAAGSSWLWEFDGIVDNDGNPIDLYGVTAVCKVVDGAGGAEVVPITFAGELGSFTLTADETVTTGTFTGANDSTGRACRWYLTLSDGIDTVHLWMSDNSKFQIRRGH